MANWSVLDRLRIIARRTRRDGLWGLWGEIRGRLSPTRRLQQWRKVKDGKAFDAQGYRTTDLMALEKMEITGDATHSCWYEAVAVADFDAIMAKVDIPVEGTTFVDLGSGMGRALLLAADLPFKRIVGVEFGRELHDVAVENFATRARKAGPDDRIELIHGDATKHAVPAGPVLYFVYNSFRPPVLTEVVRNIHASWKADPRPLRFIYLNPQHADELTGNGFEAVDRAPDYRFWIYRPV